MSDKSMRPVPSQVDDPANDKPALRRFEFLRSRLRGAQRPDQRPAADVDDDDDDDDDRKGDK